MMQLLLDAIVIEVVYILIGIFLRPILNIRLWKLPSDLKMQERLIRGLEEPNKTVVIICAWPVVLWEAWKNTDDQ